MLHICKTPLILRHSICRKGTGAIPDSCIQTVACVCGIWPHRFITSLIHNKLAFDTVSYEETVQHPLRQRDIPCTPAADRSQKYRSGSEKALGSEPATQKAGKRTDLNYFALQAF